MFRKVICLFILLSFLLVRHVQLFGVEKEMQQISLDTNHHDTEDLPEEEKEVKSFNLVDDDFIHVPSIGLSMIILSKKITHNFLFCPTTAYNSLPYTPPDAMA